jgi:hypothetical protein
LSGWQSTTLRKYYSNSANTPQCGARALNVEEENAPSHTSSPAAPMSMKQLEKESNKAQIVECLLNIASIEHFYKQVWLAGGVFPCHYE